MEDLKSAAPIALFPSENIAAELEYIVLLALKFRLGLNSEEAVANFDFEGLSLSKIGIFVSRYNRTGFNYLSIEKWLSSKASKGIRNAFNHGIVQLVPMENISSGLHLAQMGAEAYEHLNQVKKEQGFVISYGDTNMMALDLIDLPSYRIGKVEQVLTGKFMGLDIDEGYLQWVPAGLRPSLAYPTPIQTPKEFSDCLQSDLFRKACKQKSEKIVLEELRKDADQFGTPIKVQLEQMLDKEGDQSQNSSSELMKSCPITGLHEDGAPWSGAMVRVNFNPVAKQGLPEVSPWTFSTAFASQKGETVLSLISKFEEEKGQKVSFAWNGGYILNPELVGKLGISEDFIGSPLGLVITDGKLLSLPLFNKPALVFNKDGSIEIRSAHLMEGFKVQAEGHEEVSFSSSQRNLESSEEAIFYDLLYEPYEIPGEGRTIYRFAGNQIIEVINEDKKVDILPTGVTISAPRKSPLPGFEPGVRVNFTLPTWENVKDAIEAGPQLVMDSEMAINMEEGGWKTQKSIDTQAARLDYIDMRGPKIAVGLTPENILVVVAINGRIRESVGATHIDLANIMIAQGADRAMGFDPGGSVTVVANGEQLNISPYNKDYEQNRFTLPPCPRTVGNAILGILNN